MRSGVFTASESSNIAVVYALLVTALVYRSLPWSEFVEATKGAVRTTSMVLLVIGCAACFGWLLAYLKVPAQLVAVLQNVSDNPLVILLLMNVILLILGHLHGHVAAHCHHHADLSAGGAGLRRRSGAFRGHSGPGTSALACARRRWVVLFVGCAVGRISIWQAMRTIWPFDFGPPS